ncbi:hypothetical protein ACFV0T_20030 [Streptomyces sp. NPDC059582]|uniref:hypothetical protein n=1 Tax=Streptomyces sp. NPDC059582 TaxID=3346875 RepID=UPI00368CE400
MPRSRPGHVRAGVSRHRARDAKPVIDGLSSRAQSEINDLERARTYLNPGDVRTALRLWKDYVRLPERQLWDDYDQHNLDWDCCGDPLEARVLLDTVTRAISPRSARELRRIISRSDAVRNRPSPTYDPDRGRGTS